MPVAHGTLGEFLSKLSERPRFLQCLESPIVQSTRKLVPNHLSGRMGGGKWERKLKKIDQSSKLLISCRFEDGFYCELWFVQWVLLRGSNISLLLLQWPFRDELAAIGRWRRWHRAPSSFIVKGKGLAAASSFLVSEDSSQQVIAAIGIGSLAVAPLRQQALCQEGGCAFWVLVAVCHPRRAAK